MYTKDRMNMGAIVDCNYGVIELGTKKFASMDYNFKLTWKPRETFYTLGEASQAIAKIKEAIKLKIGAHEYRFKYLEDNYSDIAADKEKKKIQQDISKLKKILDFEFRIVRIEVSIV